MNRGHASSIGLDPADYWVSEPELGGGCYTAVAHPVVDGNPACPRCGGASVSHSKGGSRDVYHEPHRGLPLILAVGIRRFRCKACGRTFECPQPLLSGITPHVSKLCAEFIARRISEGATVARIEHECGPQKSIIAKVVAGMELPRRHLPVHLCIDEVRAFKMKTAVPKGLPHMCTCIYDADRRTLADMLEGDKPGVVRPYIESFPSREREAVESVSCDLNGSYIKMARELFPNADIYADRFHVAKLVTGAVDEVRKELRRSLLADREAARTKLEREKAARPGGDAETGEAAGRVKAAKAELGLAESRFSTLDRASKLMLKRHSELGAGKRAKVRAAFALDGAEQLRKAYLALQLFYAWSDADYGSRLEMSRALDGWAERARLTVVPEMARAANTITSKAHRKHVLNGYDHGRTNAVAEGLNRRIKDVIREARGFNSFDALRRRCLLVLGHEREPNKPIPLYRRDNKKGGGAD